ncbi:MAG: S28 family serine protease [Saprospiraceae bacterium]
MKYSTNFLLLLLFTANASFLFGQPAQNLDDRLFLLPDVIFEKIDTPDGFEAAYELKVKQPLDHKNPSKGFFFQRVFLTHKGFDRPTVICTEGYQRPKNRLYELTEMLEANQLDVEHRYFGESMPDSLDYQYLNLEQVAADLHHINQIFRQLYTGKWISTGISKGGQTTIYYRYFYPDDVDVSVPYVAPLNLALEEKRIYNFLDTVGSDECRARIKAVQTRLLKNRDESLEKLKWFAKGAGLKFSYLNFEQAFEYAVLEYSFSFWQWGHDCSKIPGNDVPLDSTISHFLEVSGLDFFADESMENYATHYYQAGDEMGYYGYNTRDFKGLLKALPEKPNPSAIFMPGKVPMRFDGKLPKKVSEWVDAKGNNFIYINGDSDTWSSTAVRPSGKTNSVWFFLPHTDHGKARIKNMSEADRQKLKATLEKWLNLEIKP